MNTVNLSLNQKQDLKITAELRQAIEMLTLNALEVQDLVAREMSENPLVELETERTTGADADTAGEGREEGNWDESWDNWATRGDIQDQGAAGPAAAPSGASGGMDTESDAWQNLTSKTESLTDHVRKQYDELVTEPKLRLVGQFLIDSLDESGYLRASLIEVAQKLGVAEDVVDDARALIQSLNPAGIGARDLAECLRLQLHFLGLLDPVTEVCVAHLDWVATKQWDKLAAAANCTPQQVMLALEDIQQCNPKPGLAFGTPRVEVVIPEAIVEKTPGGWRVSLNGAAFPRLVVLPPKDFMGTASTGAAAAEGKKYLTERHNRAKWLQMALEQRASTILKVAQELVKAQELFFEAGAEFLQPLTLRQVAEKVGVHESTVSRVTSGKYLQTPRGVLEFKYFFSSGVASSGGTVGVAATSVQAMIERLVRAEDPKKPLSDEKIVALLKDEGVEVARRTVAKYRGILNIPGTAERKVR